ncbi:ArsC family transcriptional regulator [Sphingomonas sp. Leaf38]|nr:ArsC family transcriptional regulator [Sphingomonas sp. Leaf38]
MAQFRAGISSPRRTAGVGRRRSTARDERVTVQLYGIANCDTMKKARRWLDDHGVSYVFHDYKKTGADAALVRHWVETLGWETVLNRAGTTFRKLPEADRVDLDASKAIALMLAQPSMIKRPILDTGETLLAGFDPKRYEAVGLGNG